MLSSILLTALTACTSALAAAIPSPNHNLTPRAALPTNFEWSSSAPLISPPSGSPFAAYKDPSIVYYNVTDLSTTAIGPGYRAAPQIFFFEPDNLWYLVFQNGNAAYSTNPDISDPTGWSAPKNFFSSVPSIITENIGNGFWLDMWVICDETNCYMFSSDDNGHLYRSETTVANFPAGFTNTVIALSDANKNALFEASNVYALGDGTYLLLVEAIGSQGRYFRSWTSSSLSGTWTPLADSESNPFAGAANVAFEGAAWTRSISHGEMVRVGYDQTLTIDPCNLRYLYQGIDTAATGDYDLLPWKLGLITQTDSAC
ncbi:hypothetical protein OHC33_004132 [Knufia fluminis]|uniref:Alpha-L-arabinofuranosidase n=1 Tax=Knufia fluminis TaxID=191047 RepID=A0AAN8I9I8_9EURO|nr:hypothetical protein OHC33_004132 [Knufia fluminis]